VRDMQRIIDALSSPVRREILTLIWDREMPAGEIAAAFEVTKPTISQHLAVLRDADLVTMRTSGTSRRYRARQPTLAGLHAALEGPVKWLPADGMPERAHARTTITPAVVTTVDVETDVHRTFAAFTDDAVYSRWLGAPVTINDGRFAATMEWGTEVRGTYEVVFPPQLIVMRWDFEDDNVPVPGRQLTGYLRITPGPGGGSHVEVHQLVESPQQAEFMQVAWTTVLGRLKTGVVEASDPGAQMSRRRPRPKRHNSA
jgi:DNA-binding transcriptional ArsR family regulator/uncharacterized protein YndB with AHSA1/START domain